MKHILIVDDMVDHIFLLEELLKGCGFRVSAAQNGEEALRMAHADPPDLALSDILMPVMDGYTLCRNWRADKDLFRIPFVFYTSTFTEQQDEALALSLGADLFLVKPQDADVLIGAISRLIASPRPDRPAAPAEAAIDGESLLKRYSEALFHKLEKKMDALRKVNQDLVEGREMLQLLFNSTAEAIYGIDLEGCCTFCNKACLDILGYDTPEELLGKNMHRQIHHTLADGAPFPVEECRIFLAFRSGKGTHVDDEVIWRKDGTPFPAEYWSYPQWQGGKTIGAVVTFIDITERRRNEALVKQMQGQIVQQEKMASIGQLAAGVAHEINNPMGFITSNLTSLGKYAERLEEYITALQSSLEGCLASEKCEELNQLRKRLKVDYIISDLRGLISESLDGADRVRRIVQDLKSFSRLDHLEGCRANLNEALETTINIAWNELKYIATLERDFGDIPPIFCYPQQLNQVFLNLLVNAAQAMEKQGVITVRTWSDDANVFVAVADTGKGMTDDIRKRIFDPFFTTKAPGLGTGLGMSISADIIHKHGGEITVESVPGSGSTFTVRLPIVNSLQKQES